MAAQEPPEPPELEGYLMKLKQARRMLGLGLGSWNKRWFVVDSTTRQLEYFHSRADATSGAKLPAGAIPLDDVVAVRELDALAFTVEAKGSSARSLLLRCESKAQRTVWTQALGTFVAQQRVRFRAYRRSTSSPLAR
ncbi:unnamed protein product [Phaeothamnion confervicola]